MKMSKAFRIVVDKARESDTYWVESAKLQFSIALDEQRKAEGLSFKGLADKIGTSAAYITKIFRGDTNATIESMVKLTRAVGGRLELRIVPETADVEDAQWILSSIAQKKKSHPTPSSATEIGAHAANDQRFALAA